MDAIHAQETVLTDRLKHTLDILSESSHVRAATVVAQEQKAMDEEIRGECNVSTAPIDGSRTVPFSQLCETNWKQRWRRAELQRMLCVRSGSGAK